MSCDANRSSIKYTKSLVFKDQLTWIKKKKIDLSKFKSILDIGANRGTFMNYILDSSRNIKFYHAIETEPEFEEIYKKTNYNSVKYDIDRIENIKLNKNTYDFIYFIHTLEHVNDVHLVLSNILDSLSLKGLLYISVPNILYECYSGFSEIFIDPHTCHFERSVLINILESVGFKIDHINDEYEPEIKIICSKNSKNSKVTKTNNLKFNIDKYKRIF